jgi:glycine betaine/choline ABC-type transport system substrate-binding protein
MLTLTSYGLYWTGRFGFNNTFTLAMPEIVAQMENIRHFSDLASVSHQYIFGAEFDFFEREDGFPDLLRFTLSASEEVWNLMLT